jgi:hypothetical protein
MVIVIKIIFPITIRKQDYNHFFRLLIYNYIKKNKNDILINNPYTLINDEIVDIEEYIELIKKNTFYTGDLEIAKTKEIFNLNLAVYYPQKKRY